MLECVVNVSEGRDAATLAALDAAAGDDLLDRHTDPHHHRSVLTLVGTEAPRRVAAVAVERIDLRSHQGVHPRIGALDVVPFVPLAGSTTAEAFLARDEFCAWAGSTLDLPCFRYGPERTLPAVRRHAFAELAPDCGPSRRHPTAGGCAVGAREVLVAYNVWLVTGDVSVAERVAAQVRGDGIRALGLLVGDRVQVSMNLLEPLRVGPAAAFDRVAAHTAVAGTELVGLVPEGALRAVPEERWPALDLSMDRTIEARLQRRSSAG